MGPYILDFYCLSLRLAVEVDGFAHDNSVQVRHDQRRDAFLAEHNVAVLRVPAAHVLRGEGLGGVLLALAAAAAVPPSGSLRSPPPPPAGEEPLIDLGGSS